MLRVREVIATVAIAFVLQSTINVTTIRFPGGQIIVSGSNSPEGVVVAQPGSIYLRSDGQTYRKTSGMGNSGWEVWVSTAEESGQIAIFDTSCPSGWTRFTALDGKFVRGASSYGSTGGAATHDHSISGNTATTGSHDHGLDMDSHEFDPLLTGGVFKDIPTSPTQANGDHNHSVSLTSGSASSLPPYAEVVFCKKN